MKRLFALALVAALTLSLTACGGSVPVPVASTTLCVLAASSLTESLDKIIQQYKTLDPTIAVIATYDSSGTLLMQIEHGADCDIFLSAAQKQMDALEQADYLLAGSRTDLLENKVVLAVPAENKKSIQSFDALAELLKSGDVLLAMGNADVPAGQYTQKIFAHYGLEESTLANAGVLTYGSNVKEVAVQVQEATVDCGVIYASDAASAGLTVADEASLAMCGQVIYPAAVLARSAHPDAAQGFLDYLRSPDAAAVFTAAGFTPLG